ncbi:MAG TPA: sialidase family protein [Gemmatimonadales bacterium]|nr:sialidase family protein [Gemmatimonadales bacterium]
MRTIALSHPEDTVSAFEPFAAIDRASPGKVYVGAQYGAGYNRGGMHLWTWSSRDGGGTWSGMRVVPKVFPAAGQALAADLTMAVGPEGTLYSLSLTADSAPTGLLTAAAVLALSTDGGRSFSPKLVFGTVESSSPGVMTFTDKSWLAGDDHATSPGRGNLYFGWSRNRVDFRDTSVTTSPAFAVSRDGGATLDSVLSLSKQGFGVTIAVRTDGTVDAAWYELRPGGSEGARVLHASSRDQGRTFGPAELVAEVADTTESIELPQITVGPGNRLLLCWTQGVPKPGSRVDVWCSTRLPEGTWGQPRAILSDSARGVAYAYPATAATDDALWLMSYAADTSLGVELYRSTDGSSFTKVATLSTAALLKASFCPRPGLPCRRSGEAFFPGDYVSLAGSAGRLVAAYPMPRPRGSAGSSTIMVSVIDP